MSRPCKDDFEQTLQISEFAAQRGEDRRQYEFKIFISYVTLLVLAIYKHDLLKPSAGEVIWLVFGLCFIHAFYMSWTISLSVANRNDSNRRNFYLQKSEYISRCLLQKFGDPLCRKMNNKYGLLNRKENEIEKVPNVFQAFKHGDQIFINYAATFQVVLPTTILVLLVYLLSRKLCAVCHIGTVIFISILPFLLIAIFTCWRKT